MFEIAGFFAAFQGRYFEGRDFRTLGGQGIGQSLSFPDPIPRSRYRHGTPGSTLVFIHHDFQGRDPGNARTG